MSGFEVVGIVLGAIPLLISGLEHYADGIRTMENMWNYEEVVNHLSHELLLAEGIFRHSCDELLLPILPDDQASKLLGGQAPDWNDPLLGNLLRTQLGSDFPTYIRAVRILEKRIRLFTKKLGLDENSRLPPWMANPNTPDSKSRAHFFRHTWKRIKGGFDTPALTNLLREINSSIKQIDKFTKGSIAVAPKRIAIEQRAASGYWLEIRDKARSLSDCLDSCWLCSCSLPHKASLRLDVRKGPATHAKEGIRFGVIFTFDLTTTATHSASVPWTWRHLEVLPKKSENSSRSLHVPAKPPPLGIKRVALHAQGNARSTVSPNVDKPSSACGVTSITPTRVPEISDLCHTLKVLPQSTEYIGYLDNCPNEHHLYTQSDVISTRQAKEIISFYEVLRRKGTRGLGVKDKYGLALTIANAVLQLHGTPWLRESWRLDDINFVCSKQDEPLTKCTYVSKTFFSSGSPATKDDTQHPPTSRVRACIANEEMFALGVSLIEISFGAPILAQKLDTDPDLPAGFMEFYIASRLVNDNEIKNHDHDKYAEVVLRCIKGHLSTIITPLSLENSNVQQSFYNDVILPLQQLNDTLYDNNT